MKRLRCLNDHFTRCKNILDVITLIGKENDDNVKDVKKRHETFANVVRAPLGMVNSTFALLYTVFGLKLGCSRAAAPIGDKVL